MAKRQQNLKKYFADRNPARFIVRLFSEGETEAVYLQKIAALHNVRVSVVQKVSSPVQLLSNAIKWVVSKEKLLHQDNGQNRIWVIFDDDAKARDMKEVVRIWKTCPDLCMQFCKIRDRNRCEHGDLLERINVGFMTPCIEIWGLMCMDGINLKTSDRVYPADRHKIQSLLHRQMPTYIHDGHPYFEIGKMKGWQQACDRADKWAQSFGRFPACIHATRYAGIAPLVREIMEG